MRKPIRKLIVRSETIRALRALDHGDLARAVGGDIESARNCPAPAVVGLYESGKVNCPAPAVVAMPAGG
jgi:hypothetical protein